MLPERNEICSFCSVGVAVGYIELLITHRIILLTINKGVHHTYIIFTLLFEVQKA